MFERLCLQVRGMGIYFFLPFVGYFLFIPLCVMAQNIGVEDMSIRFYNAQAVCYQFVPMLSTIWIFLFHKEYVEGEGREILILGKGISALTFLFWIVNIICFLPGFVFFDYSTGQAGTLLCEMILVSFVFCGLAFFLNFALESTALTMLVLMFYTMLSNVNLENFMALNTEATQAQDVAKYFYTILIDGGFSSAEAPTYIAIGTLFWLFGLLEARRL